MSFNYCSAVCQRNGCQSYSHNFIRGEAEKLKALGADEIINYKEHPNGGESIGVD